MSGTASRAIWQPASASSRSWRRELSTSVVFVLSIDWMETGAPPPMGTPPTRICFVMLRSYWNSLQISLNITKAISASSSTMPAAWT